MSDSIEDELVRDIMRAHVLDTIARERARARDPLGAAQAWTDGLALLRPGAATMILRLAGTLERSAGAAWHAGHADQAIALAHEAIMVLRGAQAGGVLAVPAFATSLGSLGMLLCAMGRFADAALVLAETETLAGEVAESPPPALLFHLQRMGALASAHHFTGRPDAAIAVLARAVVCATTAAQRYETAALNLELSQLLNTQGQILLAMGQADAALPPLRHCVATVRALAMTDHAPATRNLLAAALNRLGHAYRALDEFDDALAALEESVQLMRELVDDEGHAGLRDDLRTAIEDLDRFRRGTPTDNVTVRIKE